MPAAQRCCWLGFSSSCMRISHPVVRTQEQGYTEHDDLPCSSNHAKMSTESQISLGWRRPLRSWSPSAFHSPWVCLAVLQVLQAQKWRGSSQTEPSSQSSHQMSAQTTASANLPKEKRSLSWEHPRWFMLYKVGMTTRDKLGASQIGCDRDRAAANTGKKGGQSLRASLG